MNSFEKKYNQSDEDSIEEILESIRGNGMMDASNKITEQLGKGTRTYLRLIIAIISMDPVFLDFIRKSYYKDLVEKD